MAGTIRAGRKKRTWALNAGRDTDPDTRPMLTMPIILMLTTRGVIKGNEGDRKWEFMDARQRRLRTMIIEVTIIGKTKMKKGS